MSNFLRRMVMEGEGAAGGATTGTPPPVVTPPPPAAEAAGKAGEASFFSTWKDETVKGWVQTKGFKDSETLALSALNLEKLHGVPKERLVKLPDKAEDKDGWNEVYQKMGRPATAKEYKLPAPEGSDPGFLETAAGMFHEAGLSQDQAQKVTGKWNDYVAKVQKEQLDAHNLQFTKEADSLKKEWGAAYDDNYNAAKKAAAQFGLDANIIGKLESVAGMTGVIKFLHNVGLKLGEGQFVPGSGREGFRGNLTPANARSQREYLMSDPEFIGKYTSKDEMVRSAAVARISELFGMENAG